MNRSMRTATPLLLLATAASLAHAQDAQSLTNASAAAVAAALDVAPAAAPDSPDATQATAAVGPTLARAAAGVRTPRIAATPGGPIPAPRREETTQNRAMMIVGGAGLIVGAIIGDTAGTLVMVGSAGVGLWGLYKYLE